MTNVSISFASYVIMRSFFCLFHNPFQECNMGTYKSVHGDLYSFNVVHFLQMMNPGNYQVQPY